MQILDKAKNFVKLNVPLSYDSSATAVALLAADTAKFPQPPFNLVWYNSTDYTAPEDDPNVEIIRVTATASTSITATRAQENTTAKNHNTFGKTYKMMNVWSAGEHDKTEAAITSLSSSVTALQTYSYSGLTATALSATTIQSSALTATTITATTITAGSVSADCVAAVNHVHMNALATDPTYENGVMFYDSTRDSLAFFSSITGADLYPGRQVQLYVTNRTGTDIAKGKAVYVLGEQGNIPKVALANATYSTVGASSFAIGLAANTIYDGGFGSVICQGILFGLNTNSFEAGDKLWLSSSAGPGNLQTSIPFYPSTEGFFGTVVVKSPTDGAIFVNPNAPKSYAPLSASQSGMIFATQGSKGRVWNYLEGLSGVTLTVSGVDANRFGSFKIGLSGFSGTRTFPGSGSTTHTVTVTNGLITAWTYA